jgi:hypothetical protein
LETVEGRSRVLKTVLSVCFLSIGAALVLIDRNSPATGYELSVYESVPLLTWICLIAALAGGTGVIVHQAFHDRGSRYWLLGFFILMFSISIALLLPAFRGYYLYGSADTGAHSMWAQQIVSEGHFWQGDNYPITHILTAQIAQLSGARPELINQYIPVLFTLLFILFSYLLARSVMPKKGQALLAAAATALFFNYYHVCVYPQTLSIMLLPMVFYLYFEGLRTASASFKVVFVVVLLWFPYSHPATAAAVIFSFLSAEVAKLIWRLRTGTQPTVASKGLDRITLEPTLISSVAFLTWISSYEIFGTAIRRSLAWLRGQISEVPHVEILEETLQKQHMDILQQVELALKMYGDNLIYLALSGIALLLIAWGLWHRRGEVHKLFTLSLPFLVSGPVWVLIFVTTLRVTVGRLLGANIMMWATPVLASFALFEMFGRWKSGGMVVVTSVLTCASVVGIFGVYHSPYILQPSWQITHADVQGSQWFSDHREAETRTAVLGEVTSLGMMSLRMPDHFAYPQVQILGDLLGRDFYLLINTRFRVASAHPILARTMLSDPALASAGFSESDFVRLEKDTTVDEVYSNGGLDVMWIRATR